VSPYKSKAQAAKFHEMLGRGEISKATVDEFDNASRGLKLPTRIKPKPRPPAPKPRAKPRGK
jgi:hypothetical protein